MGRFVWLGHLLFGLFFPFTRAATPPTDFTTELEKKTLQYFLDHAHPTTGLVRDRARNFGSTPNSGKYRSASIAATGFGMAVLANAAKRGLIPETEAQARIARVLNFCEQNLFTHYGWLYHFVDWETGERFQKSEVSSIDTLFFVAGALYAAAVIPTPEITRLSDHFYRNLGFTAMRTHGGVFPDKLTLSMGWLPESGYLPPQWNDYAEHLLLLLLGMGHPLDPLPQSAWAAGMGPLSQPPFGIHLPLFVHQYSQLFVDVRQIPKWGEKLYQNSLHATRANRAFAKKSAAYATYRAGYWGLSASDSPRGYRAFSPELHDGTVCPACAGASVMFDPDPILADLHLWAKGPLAKQIYGRYGFIDSFNLDEGWFNSDVLGITVGPLYLSLTNRSDHPLWPVFLQLQPIRKALATF